MRTIGSNTIEGASPPQRPAAVSRRPDPSSDVRSAVEVDALGGVIDPRSARGLGKVLEAAAAAPALPLLSELDLILTGVRAKLEAGDHGIPDDLVRVARSVIDDEIARLAPVIDRRSAFVET